MIEENIDTRRQQWIRQQEESAKHLLQQQIQQKQQQKEVARLREERAERHRRELEDIQRRERADLQRKYEQDKAQKHRRPAALEESHQMRNHSLSDSPQQLVEAIPRVKSLKSPHESIKKSIFSSMLPQIYHSNGSIDHSAEALNSDVLSEISDNTVFDDTAKLPSLRDDHVIRKKSGFKSNRAARSDPLIQGTKERSYTRADGSFARE